VEPVLDNVVHICGLLELEVHTRDANCAVWDTVIRNREAGICLESEGSDRKTARGACDRSMFTRPRAPIEPSNCPQERSSSLFRASQYKELQTVPGRPHRAERRSSS
jgi:hypothetical protein